MDNPQAALELAVRRYQDTAQAAQAAAEDLRGALADARAAGVDLSAVAETTGVDLSGFTS